MTARGNPHIAQHSSKGAHAANRQKLTLSRVEQELGLELTSIDDAQRSLAKLRLWAAAGLRDGAKLSAAVQACREWIVGAKAKDAEAKLKALIEQQTQRIRGLEDEIARLRRRTT